MAEELPGEQGAFGMGAARERPLFEEEKEITYHFDGRSDRASIGEESEESERDKKVKKRRSSVYERDRSDGHRRGQS